MSFGPMCSTPVFSVGPEDWGLDRAVAGLLERTDCGLDGRVEHPQIVRWIQLPRILLVLQVAPDDPGSGEVFMYDRRAATWFRIDFEDQNFVGYTAAQFELLLNGRRSSGCWSSRGCWTVVDSGPCSLAAPCAAGSVKFDIPIPAGLFRRHEARAGSGSRKEVIIAKHHEDLLKVGRHAQLRIDVSVSICLLACALPTPAFDCA